MTPKVEVAIFSYNRSAYLQNAVESAQHCLPDARIRVFDDNSTDPETVAYLNSLGDMVVHAADSGAGRHGGLYANMQRAFEMAEGKYLLMLQDDAQVVRVVDAQDWQDIEAIFAATPDRAFLSVLFMKGSRMRRYRRQLVEMPDSGIYDAPPTLSEHNYKKRLAYFDICLWHVDRLRAASWSVLPSEGENVMQARETFSTMPFMKTPFVFFCPEVPFFRHRSQSIAARMAAKYVSTHLKGFVPMTERDVARMRTRPMAQWPIAEVFLTPANPKVRKPFVFIDVQARWWLYLIHKIEQILRQRR